MPPQGRLVAETNPVSGTTLMTYTTTEEQAVRDPQGNATTYGYDVAGRLITATAPISGVTQYQYDAASNTTAITNVDTLLNPIQIDTRQYDALNRVITDTLSGPSSTPLTTTTRFDKDGNTYQVVYPQGDAVVSTYDLADELSSTELDMQAVAAATHQTQSTFGYDGAGNQNQYTDYNHDSTATTYDGDNRVTQSVAVTGTSTLTTTNGYDPDANVLTATLQAAIPGSAVQTTTDTATYNAANWQTSLTDNGLATTYGYDAAGRLRTRTTNNGQITDTLDPEGRTTAISATTAGVTSYGYNQDDQPISATMPNSINGAMSYDKNSRLTGWTYSGPSTGVTTSTVNLQYGFGYDAADRTTGITVTDNGVTTSEPITHNAAGWITGWVGPSPNGPQTWGYNSDGNIISTTSFINNGFHTTVFTYSATQPNELVQQHTDSLGVDNYTYDSQGNVVSEVSTDPITSPYYVNMHFGYDALERPITMTNVQNATTLTMTLGYNAASERITYTAVMSGQVVDSEKFAYNDDGSLAQTIATTATLDGNGSIKSSGAYTDTYAYDPLGEPLYLLRQQGSGAGQSASANTYTYLTDGHGNVVGLADSAGHRVNIDTYNPYGAPVGTGIYETVPQNFGLNGFWADKETGLLFTADLSYVDNGGHLDRCRLVDGKCVYLVENNDTIDFTQLFGWQPVLSNQVSMPGVQSRLPVRSMGVSPNEECPCGGEGGEEGGPPPAGNISEVGSPTSEELVGDTGLERIQYTEDTPFSFKEFTRAEDLAGKTIDDARAGRVRFTPDNHAAKHAFSKEMVADILKDPDEVYLSRGLDRRFTFRKGYDVVITEGSGSARGWVVTAYGPSGTLGESGAAAYPGMQSTDQGMPITNEMILDGLIPRPGGGHNPPAWPILIKP